MSVIGIALSSEVIVGLAGASATLVTGVAAIVGAVVVGLKQARISRAQTELLSEQTNIQKAMAGLAELELKASLFDKRMSYYELFGRYLAAVKSSDPKHSLDMGAEFLTKSREAEFLFPLGIKSSIDAIWLLGWDYQEAAKDLTSGDPVKETQARSERKRIRAALQEAYDQFILVAGEHLRLV